LPTSDLQAVLDDPEWADRLSRLRTILDDEARRQVNG
jgi:hypothetical protein